MNEIYEPLEISIQILEDSDIVTTSTEHDNGYVDIGDLML